MIRFDTKKDMEYYDNLHHQIYEKNNEIDRLNNDIKTLLKENEAKEKVIKKQDYVINELEKYHIESMKNLENTEDFKYVGINHIKILYEEHKRTLNKLNELKENKQ